MDLVHRYCFATAPRDIQSLGMKIDNITSRQNAIEQLVETDRAQFQQSVNNLAERHAEHSDLIHACSPPAPAPSAPPLDGAFR